MVRQREWVVTVQKDGGQIWRVNGTQVLARCLIRRPPHPSTPLRLLTNKAAQLSIHLLVDFLLIFICFSLMRLNIAS